MKWVWVFIVVLLVPLSAQAEFFIPETAGQCTTMNTEFKAEVLKLVKKNKTCLENLEGQDFKGAEFRSCGPCCQGKTTTIKATVGAIDHPCTFPSRCAADRERQYCVMAEWERRLYQCRDQFPSFDLDRGLLDWKFAAAKMGAVESKKLMMLLGMIEKRIKSRITPQISKLP